VTVSRKGQVVIPAELRRKYGIDKGSRFEVHDKGGRIELEPITRNPIIGLRGKYKGKDRLTEALLQERAEEKSREDAS